MLCMYTTLLIQELHVRSYFIKSFLYKEKCMTTLKMYFMEVMAVCVPAVIAFLCAKDSAIATRDISLIQRQNSVKAIIRYDRIFMNNLWFIIEYCLHLNTLPAIMEAYSGYRRG